MTKTTAKRKAGDISKPYEPTLHEKEAVEARKMVNALVRLVRETIE